MRNNITQQRNNIIHLVVDLKIKWDYNLIMDAAMGWVRKKRIKKMVDVVKVVDVQDGVTFVVTAEPKGSMVWYDGKFDYSNSTAKSVKLPRKWQGMENYQIARQLMGV